MAPRRSADTRNRVISFAVSDAERNKLDAYASAVGLNRSAYLRGAGLRRRLRIRAQEEVARELLSIGRRMQRIGLGCDPDAKAALQDAQDALRKLITRLMDQRP